MLVIAVTKMQSQTCANEDWWYGWQESLLQRIKMTFNVFSKWSASFFFFYYYSNGFSYIKMLQYWFALNSSVLYLQKKSRDAKIFFFLAFYFFSASFSVWIEAGKRYRFLPYPTDWRQIRDCLLSAGSMHFLTNYKTFHYQFT